MRYLALFQLIRDRIGCQQLPVLEALADCPQVLVGTHLDGPGMIPAYGQKSYCFNVIKRYEIIKQA